MFDGSESAPIHDVKTALKMHRKKEEVEDRRKKLELINGQLAMALLLVQRDESEENSKQLEVLKQNLDRTLTQDAHGLSTLLRAGSGIYWTSGKAGSGKSTLMKFLGDTNHIHDLLAQWSEGRECLILVKCYFWYLGSPLQKSVEGLLRTILYQILDAYPSVAEIIFPARQANAKNAFRESHAFWTLNELQTALHGIGNVISRTVPGSSRRKFCIFVDGLDEYNGNHGELIRLLRGLLKDGNTKLCISSRPWNVFVKEFEKQTPRLFLHELTESDIRHYVESKLKSSICSLSTSGSSLDKKIFSIANDIVTRAEGVFLWVYLVVKSVTSGLDEGDEPAILRQRVLECPDDLDSFFDTIISRIDSVYRHQTAQALVLAYKYAEGDDAMAACSSYLDFELLGRTHDDRYHTIGAHTGLNDTQFTWLLEPKRLSLEEFTASIERTRSFLSASCKDLLVLPPLKWCLKTGFVESPSNVKVQFLHRTVFEYLETSGRIRLFEQNVPSCFHDGSVFHLLNMGKLKSIWDRQPVASNPYFARQTAFSLDHGWVGLSVSFIDQIRKCQPFYQKSQCPSIAAAYVAFEQFGIFQRIYTTEDHTLLLARVYSRTWKQPDMESAGVVSRFLALALPPIIKECEIASTDPVSRNDFFDSTTMQRMHQVVQILRCGGHTGSYALFWQERPVPNNTFGNSVWEFLMGLSHDDTGHRPRTPSQAAQDVDRPLSLVLNRADQLELEHFRLHMLLLQRETKNVGVVREMDASTNKRKRSRDGEPRVEDRTQSHD